jgi:hypothetical protein
MSKQFLTQVIESILKGDMDAASVASKKYFESKARDLTKKIEQVKK